MNRYAYLSLWMLTFSISTITNNNFQFASGNPVVGSRSSQPPKYQKILISVVEPSSGHIAVVPGLPVELIWRFTTTVPITGDSSGPISSSKRSNFKLFCGYHNKKGDFVPLAVDFDGK